MGAHASCFGAFTAKHARRRAPDTVGFQANYSLGKELGRGSFGFVYSCTDRQSQREFAVKRVRTYHKLSAGADIDREAEMVRKLAHPHVVKLHAVYYDARFVDMVFDRYHGDMISAAELHWESKGDIAIATINNLARQMFLGITWLHQNNIVHRDIKGDNFLLDRMDIAHPECHVVLSDFGTAIALVHPEERLDEACGTELYWAPEIYRFSYALKVDVWAAGITVQTLVTQRFPFMNEKQIRRKKIKAPSRCCDASASFLLGALQRNEEERFSASGALEHRFLASKVPAASVVDASGASPEVRMDRSDSSSSGDDSMVCCTSEATTRAPDSSDDELQELRSMDNGGLIHDVDQVDGLARPQDP